MKILCHYCNKEFTIKIDRAEAGIAVRTICPYCNSRWELTLDILPYETIKKAKWRREFVRRVHIAYEAGGIANCAWDRLHGLPLDIAESVKRFRGKQVTENRWHDNPKELMREYREWNRSSKLMRMLEFKDKYLKSAKELVRQGVLADCNRTGRNGKLYGFIPADAPEIFVWSMTEGNFWRITMPENHSIFVAEKRGKVYNRKPMEIWGKNEEGI